MSGQYVLDLPLRQARGRDAFFVAASNAQALAAVEGWRDWPGGKLLLVGAEGAGKTHLAHVWAEATGAAVCPAEALRQADVMALARCGAVVLEDAEALAVHVRSAEAGLHLHNLLAEAGGHLLLTARRPVRDWGLRLADLESRLLAAPVARIKAPDDTLLAALLVKQFADRQLAVAPSLIGWMVRRMPRTPAAARAVVEAVDARALSEGRAVNRVMAAEAIVALEALAAGAAPGPAHGKADAPA
jgi:chromosomal replication initiation ATPase DnaA